MMDRYAKELERKKPNEIMTNFKIAVIEVAQIMYSLTFVTFRFIFLYKSLSFYFLLLNYVHILRLNLFDCFILIVIFLKINMI